MKLKLKACIIMSLFSVNTQSQTTHYHEIPLVQSPHDVSALFPKTPDEIRHKSQMTLKIVQSIIEQLIALPLESLTYDNTVRMFDMAIDIFARTMQSLEILLQLSAVEALRTAAQDEIILMQQTAVDLLSYNKELFQVLSRHAQTRAITEELAPEERYFEQEVLEEFIRNGLSLPDETRTVIRELQKELAKQCTLYDKNISSDTTTITVSPDELDGLEQEYIDTLKKTADGNIMLGVDYPTYYKILEQCHNQNTRKKIFHAYSNRAYPANSIVLEKIISLRDELAQLLQFDSYAHLNISSEMAKNPETVEQFLYALLEKSAQKEALEVQELLQELPASVELSPEGNIQPWDRRYITEAYKKKNYDIDEYVISEYFPMEKTIEGLLKIYETFFSLTFKQITIAGLWHDEVRALEVYRSGALLGYILLDLYPRNFKYSHACEITVVPALLSEKNEPQPAVVVVVANFPRPSDQKPSLLSRIDVSTFFHEFGHALHAILGATRLASQSGTHTKHDFVEMPSQMLEEWLFDKDILSNLSSHYITGEKLSSKTIATLLRLKNFSSGFWVTRQIFLSLISLEYYKPGAQKDTQAIMKTLHEKTRHFDQFYPHDHSQAAFVHLTSYGARYYGYLWSKVFALDLFDTIKQHGLLDPNIGAHYLETVLSKGGSKDPNDLLFDFLGRAPNNEAFLKDLGL